MASSWVLANASRAMRQCEKSRSGRGRAPHTPHSRALRQGAFTLREFARAARMPTNAKRMKWKWLNRWAEKTAEG